MKTLKLAALALIVLACCFAVTAQADSAIITGETSETSTDATVTVETASPEASQDVTTPTALEVELGIAPYNPCYQFDNPSIGCYHTWSPQTYCCLGNNKPGCYDVCY